jgi:hypothetical protein
MCGWKGEAWAVLRDGAAARSGGEKGVSPRDCCREE